MHERPGATSPVPRSTRVCRRLFSSSLAYSPSTRDCRSPWSTSIKLRRIGVCRESDGHKGLAAEESRQGAPSFIRLEGRPVAGDAERKPEKALVTLTQRLSGKVQPLRNAGAFCAASRASARVRGRGENIAAWWKIVRDRGTEVKSMMISESDDGADEEGGSAARSGQCFSAVSGGAGHGESETASENVKGDD